LCGLSGRSGAYCDDVRLESDAFGSQGWEPLAIAVRRKVVDSDGLPVHIAEVVRALEKRFKSCRPQRTWIECKEAEPRDSPGLLRVRRERQCRRAAEQRDEVARKKDCES